MARVGGALSPLIFGLDYKISWLSNTIFGTLSFIGKHYFSTVQYLLMTLAMISSMFLPETLGMPLSQTMEEAEANYYKTPEELKKSDNDVTVTGVDNQSAIL